MRLTAPPPDPGERVAASSEAFVVAATAERSSKRDRAIVVAESQSPSTALPPDPRARIAAFSDAFVVAATAERSSKLDRAIVRTQARDALVTMGWRSGVARDAVEAAASHAGRDVSLEALVREALRRCPLSASAMTRVG